METSPSKSRTARALLALCLIGLLLVIGYLAMRDQSSRGIPSPFGGALRGQLETYGTTRGQTPRNLVAMRFGSTQDSEDFHAPDLTSVYTPAATSPQFSSGAPLLAALSAGKVYGYRYSSLDYAGETAAADAAAAKTLADPSAPIYYSDLFPGQFFASAAELADPDSGMSVFLRAHHDLVDNGRVKTLTGVVLSPDALYMIVTEEPTSTLTVRGLTWCGDGVIQAPAEECDIGRNGNVDGSGCTKLCKIETGFICSGEPSVCTNGAHNATLAYTGPDQVGPGDVASFLLSLQNNAAHTDTLQVISRIPAELSFHSDGSDTHCTATVATETNPSVLTCDFGLLNPGQSIADVLLKFDVATDSSLCGSPIAQHMSVGVAGASIDPEVTVDNTTNVVCHAAASSAASSVASSSASSVNSSAASSVASSASSTSATWEYLCNGQMQSTPCSANSSSAVSSTASSASAESWVACDAGYLCSKAEQDGQCVIGDPIGSLFTDKNCGVSSCSGKCYRMNTWYNPTEPKDVNGDGVVTLADYTALLGYVNSFGGAGLITVDTTIKPCPDVNPATKPYPGCDPTVKFYPDVEGNGSVGIQDIEIIAVWLHGQCGNGGSPQTDLGEMCDNGAQNTDTACSASYDGICNYCDTTCKSHVVSGGFCGDGQQQTNEDCDDGKHCTLDHSIVCTTDASLCTGHGDCVKLDNSCSLTCKLPPIPFID